MWIETAQQIGDKCPLSSFLPKINSSDTSANPCVSDLCMLRLRLLHLSQNPFFSGKGPMEVGSAGLLQPFPAKGHS